MNVISKDHESLIESIKSLIQLTKNKVAVYVNAELILLYWNIGDYVNTFILEGNRASYSKAIIKNLAQGLTLEFGKGWSEKQLRHCLRCAAIFTKAEIVSAAQRQLKTLVNLEKMLG